MSRDEKLEDARKLIDRARLRQCCCSDVGYRCVKCSMDDWVARLDTRVTREDA